MNLSSLKGSVFWVVIYAKKTNKITKNLTLGLSLLLKIVEKIGKYLETLGYFLLIFSIFSKDYLGYLKIKQAAHTLGMVCFCCNVKPFGWYVSAKNGIVKVPPCFPWYLKGFLVSIPIDSTTTSSPIQPPPAGAQGPTPIEGNYYRRQEIPLA